ncbi:DUF2721 domain-containing protein [Candidatus Woesearchaeota archaeon]|nr:DUF2721 domain-containing protein [Candidatus Woesearchaeota archaeon]
MESIAISFIQQVVTPTILVSASGLLLLGLQNKYARIVDRIRAVREGKKSKINDLQLRHLFKRAQLLRTAIFSLYVGILFFILTSITIGMYAMDIMSDAGIIIFFGTGLFAMFLGIIHAVLDVQNSFRIILLELKRRP